MSLSVKENRLVAVNQLGENTLQTVLQGKVELPGTAAPVGRIVWVKGIPVLEAFTADQDRVYVQGAIDLEMVYEPETLEGDTAGLRRVEWPGALPFDHYVEVIGAEPGMGCWGESTILVCEWDLTADQYGLNVDLIVATTVGVEETKEFTTIQDVNISNQIKINTDGLLLNPCTPPFKLEVGKEVTGILQWPEDEVVQTIVDLEAELSFGERELQDGVIVLKGTTLLKVLYETEDYSVKKHVFDQVLPFELVFENKGIKAGMQLEKDLIPRCEAYVVNDGRDLRVELQIEGEILLRKQEPQRVLTDIITPGNVVEVRQDTISIDNFVTKKEQQFAARGLLELEQRLPPIRELLRSKGTVYLTDYEVEEDKLTLEGVVDLELYYTAHSEEDPKPLFRGVFPEAINFQHTVVISGLEPGMQPKINLEVAQVQPDLINRETVEVVVTLKANVVVLEYLELDIVVEAVQVGPPLEDPPSLTYIFIQPGDTVWKLSRQYHTSEEAILDANPSLQHNPDLLKPGDCLLIPKSN